MFPTSRSGTPTIPTPAQDPSVSRYLQVLNAVIKSGLDVDYSKRSPDYLANSRLGYTPTYWQYPQNVVRWHDTIKSAPPEWKPPNWLNSGQVENAYQWMQQQNQNTPASEWKFLASNDPGLKYIADFQVPPTDYLFPQEKRSVANTIASVQAGQSAWSSLAPDQRQNILSDPKFDILQWDTAVRNDILADPDFDWERLPAWQEVYWKLMSNPYASAAITSLPLLPIAGPLAPVIGVGLVGLGEAGQYLQGQQTPIAQGAGSVLSWAAKAAQDVMGIGAQTMESSLGFGLQTLYSAIKPDEYGDLSTVLGSWDNIKAAYQAGRGAYESSPLLPGHYVGDILQMIEQAPGTIQTIAEKGLTPASASEIMNRVNLAGPGKVWEIGRATPVGAPNPMDALEWTRGQIEAGEDPETAVNTMISWYGMSGAMADLTTKLVADPLWALPRVGNKVGAAAIEISQGDWALGLKALTSLKKLSAADVAKLPVGARELYLSQNLPEAKRLFASFSRMHPWEEPGSVASMFGFTRKAAEITEKGVLAAGKFTQEGLLDKPVELKGPKGWFNYLKDLTPEARALTGQGLAQDHLAQILDHFKDPAQAAKFLDSVAKGDMQTAKTMAEGLVGSPEFYTILPVLKQFVADKLPGALAIHEAAKPGLAIVDAIGDAIGMDRAGVIRALERSGGDERVFYLLQENLKGLKTPEAKVILDDITNGRFTADKLKAVTELFTGEKKIPWDNRIWNGMLVSMLDDHFGKWAVQNFDIKPGSIYFRFAHALKSVQSILLMGANPAYMLRNTVNDITTRAVSGVGGFLTPREIKGWLNDWGYTPARFGEGIGMVGEGAPGTATAKAIRDATNGKGMVRQADSILRGVLSKMPMTRLSGFVEGMEGQQANAIAMRKMWPRLWRRGVGFENLDPALTKMLTDIDPNMPNMVYEAIEAGMSRQAIEANLNGRYTGMQARALVNDAARTAGVEPRDVAMNLDQLGVMDRLDVKLRNADTPERVRTAFEDVSRHASDQMDRMTANDLPKRKVDVQNRVQLEGPTAIMDEIANLNSAHDEAWLNQYVRLGDAFEKINTIDDAGIRETVVRNAMAENRANWQRTNAKNLTTITGMMEALGWSDEPHIQDFLNSTGRVNKIWDEAYKFQFDEYSRLHNQYKNDWSNPQKMVDYASSKKFMDDKFLQAFADAHDLMTQQGDSIGVQLGRMYGTQAQDVFLKGWSDIVRYRDNMVERLQEFRKSAQEMPFDKRAAAKTKFYSQEYPGLIVQYGSLRKLFGEDTYRSVNGMQPVTPEPGQPGLFTQGVEQQVGVMNAATAAHDATIFGVANKYGFSSADAGGQPNPRAKVDLMIMVKQYGGGEGARVRRFSELTPELVDKAFQNKAERAALQMAMEPAPIQEAQPGPEEAQPAPSVEAAPVPEAVAPTPEQARITLEEQHRNLAQDRFVGKQEPRTAKDYFELRKPLEKPLTDALGEMLKQTSESPAKAPKALLQFITEHGGIKDTLKLDVTGETKGRAGMPPGLFTKAGMGMDDLATLLQEHNYILQSVLDDPAIKSTDFVSDMVRRAVGGEKITPIGEVMPDWIKGLGGSENAARLVQQILTGTEDPAAKRVQNIKADAWDWMQKNIQEYPDARAYLKLPFDEHTSSLPGRIDDLMRQVTDLKGIDPTEGVRKIDELVNDLTDLYSSLPEDAPEGLRQKIEIVERVMDARDAEFNLKLKQADAQANLEARGQTAMTREMFGEMLRDDMNLPADQVDSVLAVHDGAAKWYSRVTGESPDAYWQHYAGIVRGGEGELLQGNPRLTPEQMGDYARALVRSGADELRRAVEGEYDTQSRMALLDEARKFDPSMADEIAEQTKGILLQPSKGATSFLENGRAVIHAFEGADVSTALHEGAHIWRSMLQEVAEKTGNPEVLADLRKVEDWAGVKSGEWTKPAEEKFARGMENYFATGKAPTPALVRAFANFKTWLLEIYHVIIGSPIDVKVTPEVKAVFDRMMGQEPLTNAYDGLTPGTSEWMTTWKAHPELQEQMTRIAAARNTAPTSRQLYEMMTPAEQMQFSADGTIPERLQNVTATTEQATGFGPTAPALHAVGDIVKLPDGTQATITKVRPDAMLELDNGRVVSAASVERVAAQGNLFGEQPPTQQTALFQDTDPRFPPGGYEEKAGQPDIAGGFEEGWQSHIQPVLDAMEQEALKRVGREPVSIIGGADDATQATLRKYVNQVYQDMSASKLQTVRYAEMTRDFALLNYSRRYGFDKFLDMAYPYQFWYTRSLLNWAMRGLDVPAVFSNYARVHAATNTYQRNIPERLRGKIAIPTPFLPDWMGSEMYIDPFGYALPFQSFSRPFEMLTRDQNTQVGNAQRLVREWAADGSVSQNEASQALSTQDGDIWKQAMAQAAIDQQNEVSNPLDFMSLMLGPAWYLSTPLNLLGVKVPGISTGKPSDVSETPLTSTTRAIEAVTQGTPLQGVGQIFGAFSKPETWVREQLKLPQMGEYGDYYVDRMLSSMVGDGTIDTQTAEQTMIERTGPVYDQAVQRVKLELASKVPLAQTLYAISHGESIQNIGASVPASIFGGTILPAGELKFRGLSDKWNYAWKQYDEGDTEAITKFFDDYPEYGAYLSRKQTPEKRIRNFLVNQIWEEYMALEKPDKRMASNQLGTLFQDAFLNTETRNYDGLDVDTLAMWARALGGTVPKTPAGTPANLSTENALQGATPTLQNLPGNITSQLSAYNQAVEEKFPGIYDLQDMYFSMQKFIPGASQQESAAILGYRDAREKLFPDWSDLQEQYFAMPKSQRKAFLEQNPQLSSYWDWAREQKAEHPEILEYLGVSSAVPVEFINKTVPEYWDFRKAYIAKHPDVRPFIDRDYAQSILTGKVSASPETRQALTLFYSGDFDTPVYTTQDYLQGATSLLIEQISDYANLKQPLSTGGMTELRMIWETAGKPGKSLQDFLDNYIVSGKGQ